MKPIRSIVVVYKRSARSGDGIASLPRQADARFRPWMQAHQEYLREAARSHQQALERVLRFLRKQPVFVQISHRITTSIVRRADVVICIGGDGTFLEAARHLRVQPMVGVNSDPRRSVGSFCSVSAARFESFFDQMMRGKRPVVFYQRLRLELNGKRVGIPVLNEALITHERPAAMSRYGLQIGRVLEHQRSSGLWISTAAGSTGAIHSAGGQILPRVSKKIFRKGVVKRLSQVHTQKGFHQT